MLLGFGLIEGVFIFCVACMILAALSPAARKFFKNSADVGNAKLNSAADGIRRVAPLEQYKAKIEAMKSKIEKARGVVARSGALVESLKLQVKHNEEEIARLSSRIKRALSSGDPNKSAASNALALADAEKNLAVNKAQLAANEKTYLDNIAAVSQFEDQIVDLRKDAASLATELERSEVEKMVAEASTALHAEVSIDNDLQELRNNVQGLINENRGSARAHNDLNAGSLSARSANDLDDEAQRQEEAEAILARFATKSSENA